MNVLDRKKKWEEENFLSVWEMVSQTRWFQYIGQTMPFNFCKLCRSGVALSCNLRGVIRGATPGKLSNGQQWQRNGREQALAQWSRLVVSNLHQLWQTIQNLIFLPSICQEFLWGVDLGLWSLYGFQFPRSLPGIAPDKFPKGSCSWHYFLAKCWISCSDYN